MPLLDFCFDLAKAEPNRNSEQQQQQLEALKRKARTEKARASALLSRQQKRLEEEHGKQGCESSVPPVQQFQHTYFKSPGSWAWGEQFLGRRRSSKVKGPESYRERVRAVWLYFKCLAKSIISVFAGDGQGAEGQDSPEYAHVISINVADDTDIKLASGHLGSGEVRAVFNNIQEHLVARKLPDNSANEGANSEIDDGFAFAFLLHQPLFALARATTEHVLSAMLSWSLNFCGSVGWRLRRLGMPNGIFRNVRRHVFIFAGDALKVNNAIFGNLIKVARHRSQEEHAGLYPWLNLQIQCLIHQACLTRKTLALGFDSYWSTLVRFAHLFESRNFRQKFYTAIARLVKDNFDYIPIQQMPPEAVSWKELKMSRLKVYSDPSVGSGSDKKMSKRYKSVQQILKYDNGEPFSSRFVHFCTGQNCCPNGHHDALASMIKAYIQHFDYMPVPLLYRWKHAVPANSFVRDGFFLHRVLPRALDLFPTVKCILSWPP